MDELDWAGNRCAVEMHVEGTHKNPDENLGAGNILPDYIVESGFNTLFYREDFLIWRHFLHVNNGAVGRAEDAGTLWGNASGRIPEKPDITPI